MGASRVEEQGLEAARAYATWARLEREFALRQDAGGGRLLLPQALRSRERFLALLEWMATSSGGRCCPGIVIERFKLTKKNGVPT